ncbi:MAG: Holliday junction branch migration protein RuvA [SAR86 cluster bacterium]|uniref:Holliday junction branch migration complex subunit RuvA n=1 Tax=SAR86 cluster bacterium TaxID=2030880 RepID=A0A2A5B8F1_9GAMM|nr:MAG: Holliday junction branch migration protein RuvA [SAR86 cluster bacterium]
MIGRIRGVLVGKNPPEIQIDVSGITYEIQVPMSTAYKLPDIGQELVLHTHFVVREDAQLLYGFFDVKDKTMFRSLIKVNGVGPKMALGILSGMEADDFVRTVRANDINALVKMPGIGKKTAERLLIEMRDRLGDWDVPNSATTESGSSPSFMSKDAETALISLGYKPQQAAHAIAQVMKNNPDIGDSEELIRQALKSMV